MQLFGILVNKEVTVQIIIHRYTIIFDFFINTPITKNINSCSVNIIRKGFMSFPKWVHTQKKYILLIFNTCLLNNALFKSFNGYYGEM